MGGIVYSVGFPPANGVVFHVSMLFSLRPKLYGEALGTSVHVLFYYVFLVLCRRRGGMGSKVFFYFIMFTAIFIISFYCVFVGIGGRAGPRTCGWVRREGGEKVTRRGRECRRVYEHW